MHLRLKKDGIIHFEWTCKKNMIWIAFNSIHAQSQLCLSTIGNFLLLTGGVASGRGGAGGGW